jgi:hypothetical protein
MGGSKPGSSTSQSASQPPQEFLNAYSNLINSATALTKQPLQQYSGPMVAGFTPQQQQGFQEIQNSQGLSQPYINTAATLAGEAGSPVTGQQIKGFESPYTKDVINATQAQFNNTNEQNAAQAKANQIGSGAYGGDRAGVAQAALTGQENTAQAPVIAGLQNQNFMQAENEANLQHQNELSSSFQFGNLGNEAQNSALTGAAAELQAGGQQQQLAQEQMNIPYEQFMQQQMFPYQQLGWLGNLTEGLGSLSGGSGTSTTNQAGSGIMGLFGFDKGGKVRDGFSSGGGLDPMIEYSEIAGENRKGYDDGGSVPPLMGWNNPDFGSGVPENGTGVSPIRTMPFSKAAAAFGEQMRPDETSHDFVQRVNQKRRELAQGSGRFDENGTLVSRYDVGGRTHFDDGGSISQSPYMMYSEIAGENANRGGFSPGPLPAVPDPAVDIIPPSSGNVRGPGPPGAPSSAVQQSSSGSSSMSPMQGLQMGQQMAGMFSGPSGGAGAVGALPGGMTDFTGGSALTEASGGLGGLSGLGAQGASAGAIDAAGAGASADAAGSAAAGSSIADLWPMLLALFHDGGRVGFSRGGYGGGGGAVKSVSAPGGFSYPQVSSSLFSGPSKTDPVTGGLPGSFNPLAQWKPPGTGPNNELPHYTMPVNPAFDYLGPVGPAGGGLNGISYGGSGPGYWRGMTPPAPYAEGGRAHYADSGAVSENGGDDVSRETDGPADVNVDGQPATSGFSPPGDRAATPEETPDSFKQQPGMLYAPHKIENGYTPPEHGMLNPILTGLFTALGSNSRSSLGAMGEGALAGLKESQHEDQIDAKPEVDHSGATTILRYGDGTQWDTGLATDSYMNHQESAQLRKDTLASTEANRKDTLAARQQDFAATQQYRLADINAKREAAGEPPIASLDAANAGAAAPGQGGDLYTQFANKMGALENTTGNRAAPNASGPNGTPTSSAVGDDQFTQNTWLRTVRDARPELAQIPDAQLLQLRKDPAFSTEMTAELAKHNGAELSQAGQPVTMESLALAHRFGSQGALAVLNATPDTPMTKLLSPKAIQANPTLANQTAGQYVQTLNQQLGPTQTAQANPAAFGKFDKPQMIEIPDGKGGTTQQLAQQNVRTGQWVSADQNRTPIDASGMRIVSASDRFDKPQEIEVGDGKGGTRQILAQQNQTTGQWVSADQKRTPINASDITIMPSGAGGGGGRFAGQVIRIMTAAKQASNEIGNLVQMPLTASTGIFGGRTQGPSLFAATKEVLANEVTSQEVQDFNTSIIGMGKALSSLESGGMQTNQALINQFDKLALKEGDTNFTKLRKLATMRQDAEGAVSSVLTSPLLGRQQKQYAQGLIDTMRKNIPWSPNDVTRLEYSQNPQSTIGDFARSSGLGGTQSGAGGTARVSNDNDYAKLASGTRFVGPDGKTRIKP